MKRRICLSLGNYKALCSRPKCFSFACSLQQSPKLYHPHNSAPSIKLTFCYMDNFCLANYKILHYQSNFTDILGFTNLAQLPSAGCFSTIVFSVLYLQILLDRRQALRFFLQCRHSHHCQATSLPVLSSAFAHALLSQYNPSPNFTSKNSIMPSRACLKYYFLQLSYSLASLNVYQLLSSFKGFATRCFS